MEKQGKSPWSLKEYIEPHTQVAHRIYYYKNKICKRIILDSQLARQLAGYGLIEKDLRSAALWVKEIERIRGDDQVTDHRGSRISPDRERYNIVKGLFVAALTFYGKSFAQAEGRRVKLERRQIDPKFHDSHDEAISFRNNFAAHSGAKAIEKLRVVLVLPPKTKKTELPNVYRELEQPDWMMPQGSESGLHELAEHARLIPLRKIDELNQKILAEEIAPKGYDYWASK